jgi:hypothetical protein
VTSLELRRELLREAGQVGCRPLPVLVQRLAHHRPARDRLGRLRNLETALLDRCHGALDGVGNRDAHEADRHDQDEDGEQHDQGRGATILAAQPGLEPALQRVDRDRQDHRPEHQVEERVEYLEAEQPSAATSPARISTSSRPPWDMDLVGTRRRQHGFVSFAGRHAPGQVRARTNTRSSAPSSP